MAHPPESFADAGVKWLGHVSLLWWLLFDVVGGATAAAGWMYTHPFVAGSITTIFLLLVFFTFLAYVQREDQFAVLDISRPAEASEPSHRQQRLQPRESTEQSVGDLGWSDVSPNIICLRDERGPDVVRLDRHQVFRESEYDDAGALRAVSAAFVSAPNAEYRLGKAERVSAQIVFSTSDWPEREEYRVHHGCWLNEESPYVSFDYDTPQHLIIGTFQHKIDGKSGFEPDFTTYGTSKDRNAPLTTWSDRFSDQLNVRVNLINADSGKVSSYDYDLQVSRGGGFSFGYIDEKDKELRRKSQHDQFTKLLTKGEELFNTPLMPFDWDSFRANVHAWTSEVSRLLRRSYGLAVSSRFDGSSHKRHPYPHWAPQAYRERLDELYSQFIELESIAAEVGVHYLQTDREKLRIDVARKRLSGLILNLQQYASRGDGLISAGLIISSSEALLNSGDFSFGLRKWESDLYDYVETYLDQATASSIFADTTMVQYPMPEGARTYHKNHLDQIYTRLINLNTLIDNLKRGQRAL